MSFKIETGQCVLNRRASERVYSRCAVANTGNKSLCLSIQKLVLCEMEFIPSLWCEVIMVDKHQTLINTH
jgi:hypothetical protein